MVNYTNPSDVFTEELKHVFGSGSANNFDDLKDLYTESKFDLCYQFVLTFLQMYSSFDDFDTDEYESLVVSFKLAIEDYNKDHDKKDFVRWIEHKINSN
jgi:hypothetical protein